MWKFKIWFYYTVYVVIRHLPLLREEFRIPKLTFHSDLWRLAASRLALPCTSSFCCLLLSECIMSSIHRFSNCWVFCIYCGHYSSYHRLNGSSSPVLTATCLSYGRSLCDFIFPQPTWRSHPSTDFDAKWIKRRGFMNTCALWSKNRNFLKPLIPRPPKPPKFAQFWSGLKIFARFRV